VPFIARYRKEQTGGLSGSQLRTLEERLRYLREPEDRRTKLYLTWVAGKFSDGGADRRLIIPFLRRGGASVPKCVCLESG
jgi:hypothetical protein